MSDGSIPIPEHSRNAKYDQVIAGATVPWCIKNKREEVIVNDFIGSDLMNSGRM